MRTVSALACAPPGDGASCAAAAAKGERVSPCKGSMGRIHRLRGNAAFKLLREEGRVAHSRLFRILTRPNGLHYLRLALVAPRSIDKRSTARNRVRRRAREWIRTHHSLLASSRDLVIVFKGEALRAPRRTFYAELAKTIGAVTR